MSLTDATLRGVAWSLVGAWTARLMQVVVFTMLARLLQPSDFGIVAIATLLVALLSIVQEQGFGAALVQRPHLEDEHLDTAFWFSMAAGTMLTTATIIAAPIIASIMSEPELTNVIRYISPTFVLSGLMGTPSAILRRRMEFRSLTVRAIASSVIGGLVGLACAIAGLGVWALVAQTLATTATSAITLWYSVSWRPSFRYSKRHWRELSGFGINVLGIDVLNFVNRRSDDILIGAFIGSAALGVYTVAYRVLTILTELFTGTLSNVTLPAFSSIQDDLSRLRRGYISATRIASVVAIPAFLAVAGLAPEIVMTFFGPQWIESVPILRWLTLIGALHSVYYFNSSVLLATGNSRASLNITLMNAILNVIAFSIAIRWGVQGVAIAYVIRGYVTSPVPLIMVKRVIGISYSNYARNLAPGVLIGIGVFVACIAATAQIGPLAPPLARLAIGLAAAALTYTILVVILARRTGREMISHALALIPQREQASSTQPNGL